MILEPEWPSPIHDGCNYNAVRPIDDSGLFCMKCGFMWSATAARLELALARIGELRDLLGALHLYVNWQACTRPLTTDQKTLWADCVDEWAAVLDDDPTAVAADRWWVQ